MNELTTQEKNIVPYSDIEKMGNAFAKSGLFGVKTPEQAIALMLVAQAEGRHPATIAMEYDIIAGRPALKSQTALIRFQNAGGKIKWITRTEIEVSAEFSHPACESLIIKWDIKRAEKMGYMIKDNWKKQTMIMMQWRVVAEGVRACYPACLGGAYLDSEVMDFDTTKIKPVEVNYETVKEPIQEPIQEPSNIDASKKVPSKTSDVNRLAQTVSIRFDYLAKKTPLPKENYRDCKLLYCAELLELKELISSKTLTEDQLKKVYETLNKEPKTVDNFISHYMDALKKNMENKKIAKK